MGNFMGYNSATELFTAIGTKIKAKYTKPSGGIPKSDLSSLVQTSLNKADSALQSETDPTVPSWAKQPNKPSYTQDEVPDGSTYKRVTQTEKNAWNGKQNALSTTQMQAVNSGITSKKVTQISTNQTNILYVADSIGKNFLNIENITGATNATYTSTKTSVTITSTGTYGNIRTKTHLKAGKYVWSCTVSNLSAYTGESPYIVMYVESGGSDIAPMEITSNGDKVSTVFTISTEADYYFYIYASRAGSTNNTLTVSNLMLCTEEAWNISHAYEPYALPNYDLTYLEAEDRAALAEEIDAGAKNKFDISTATFDAYGDTCSITYNSNSSATIKQVSGGTNLRLPGFVTRLEAGTYILSGCPSGGSDSTYRLDLRSISGSSVGDVIGGSIDYGSGSVPFTITTAGNYYITVRFASGYTVPTAGITIKPMLCTKAAFGVSQKFVPFGNDAFYQVPINHNMIYRGRNLGATLTDAQHTALSNGNFTNLYLGDYWTKTVTIPAGTYTGGDGEEVTVPAQTNITLKAVIADFDTFYAGYASSYAGINTHHAAVIVTGFSNVVWNKTNSTAGGYVNSLIHKWLVGSALPQIETWFGSAKVLSHQKLLTNAITGDAASGWAWSSQKISLLSENQMYGSKIWGNSKADNGGYEPGEAFKHLNVFNHIDTNLLFGNKNIWLRDIASAVWAADPSYRGAAGYDVASNTWIAPAALILLS